MEDKPTWVNRLGPKWTQGNDRTAPARRSRLGDLPRSTQAHPFSTSANSETLRSTPNRVQERSNFNRLSAASPWPSRYQPYAVCKWECPRSQCPGQLQGYADVDTICLMVKLQVGVNMP